MGNLQSNTKTSKLKLDFKDSKYATGRRKTSIAKVWLKRARERFTLMENYLMNIFLMIIIKCNNKTI